jgi:integrase
VPPITAAVASSPKLLDRVRWHLRVKHYSIRTEQAYVDWIRRYILFHRKRHPREMGEREITEFLTHLAYLPFALERKYRNANRSWAWQYAFPAAKVSTDPRSGEARRHHVSEKNLQKAVKAAVERAGTRKAASCHTLRHSFATHLL